MKTIFSCAVMFDFCSTLWRKNYATVELEACRYT